MVPFMALKVALHQVQKQSNNKHYKNNSIVNNKKKKTFDRAELSKELRSTYGNKHKVQLMQLE